MRNILRAGSLCALAAASFMLGSSTTADAQRGRVCFYEHDGFRGRAYCAPVGAVVPDLPRGINDTFSSVRISRGAVVTACQHADFRGECIRLDASTPSLGRHWNDRISSFRSRWF